MLFLRYRDQSKNISYLTLIHSSSNRLTDRLNLAVHTGLARRLLVFPDEMDVVVLALTSRSVEGGNSGAGRQRSRAFAYCCSAYWVGCG